MMWVVAAVIVVSVVIVLVVLRKRPTQPISVVILRSSPLSLSEAAIRTAYQNAFGSKPDIKVMPLSDSGVSYLLTCPSRPPLGLILATKPYAAGKEIDAFAKSIEDPSLKSAIVSHRAWCGIDAVGMKGSQNDAALAAIHSVLGVLAAQFVDEQSLLVYLPHQKRVAPATKKLVNLLSTGKTADVFREIKPQKGPVFYKNNDPELAAAERQALETLPECVAAFQQLGASSNAMVKARFATKRGGESLWLMLQAIEGDAIVGRIDNEAIDKSLPRKSEITRVKREDVVDWAYIDAKGGAHGLRSERILRARMK
jgi:uncharacterized protein YegJ (DUF2314 family)